MSDEAPVTGEAPQAGAAPPSRSIADLIAAEGGRVTFARFMQLALTHPTLGYYSTVDRLLRHDGDFSTAPALSPFFNRTLARLLTELVDAALATYRVERPALVELGGGEGHLAQSILTYWSTERPDLRGRVAYRIVEVEGALRRRQAEALGDAVGAGWQIGWGSTLAEACAGTQPLVMVGNEFLDALPVHLLKVETGAVREAYVQPAGDDHDGLLQTWGDLSDAAAAELRLLLRTTDPLLLAPLSSDGMIEVSPGLDDLYHDAAALMPAGSLVTIDYGDWLPVAPAAPAAPVAPVLPAGPAVPASPDLGDKAALPGRPGYPGSAARLTRRRTLRGYFKHQLELDPLARPGRQDLTADVDFAAADVHGRLHGFQTILFTTLSAFLRAGGAEAESLPAKTAPADRAAPADDPLETDRQATVLRHLLDERDLGGAFKLMVQARE